MGAHFRPLFCNIPRISGSSGTINTQIRGIDVIVYCKLDTTPAETFLELEASSLWGGGHWNIIPYQSVEFKWSKVKINITACFIFLYREDWTFAVLNNQPDLSTPPKTGYYGTAKSK